MSILSLTNNLYQYSGSQLFSAWSILLWAAHVDRFLPSYICDLFWWYGVCYVIIFKLLRFMWHCKWYGGFHLPLRTSFIIVHHTNHLHFSLQHSQQVYMLWCTSASIRSEIRRILLQQEFLVSAVVYFYSSLTSKTFPPRASSCHYKHNRY